MIGDATRFLRARSLARPLRLGKKRPSVSSNQMSVINMNDFFFASMVMVTPTDGVDSCSAHYIRNYFNELKRNAWLNKKNNTEHGHLKNGSNQSDFDHSNRLHQRAYQSN